jgi:glycosyltransferase involved in cell wall biosynthesis
LKIYFIFSKVFMRGITVKLSVIIPCYNGADTIGGQLEALASQEWSQAWEVIVADNGSNDGTRAVVEKYMEHVPNLRVVDASERRGRSFARNAGAQAACGECLAFCDADDEIGPGWVRAIGEALEIYEFVASRWDTEKLNNSPRQQYFANPAKDGLLVLPYPPYLSYAATNGLGIKRSLHERVGGFDEAFVVAEDTDYCIRVQNTGAELHFVPDAVVYYRLRDNPKGIMAEGYGRGYYSVLIYKCHGAPEMRVSGGWRQSVFMLVKLLCMPPILSGPSGKMRWVWGLAWQVGRLVAGVRHGIEPPFHDRSRSRESISEVSTS